MGKDNKCRFIEEVQRLGEAWHALASNDAIEAIRKPADESLQRRAAISVASSDRVCEITKSVINLVHMYWPQEEAKNAQA